jgi:hypothetical protein
LQAAATFWLQRYRELRHGAMNRLPSGMLPRWLGCGKPGRRSESPGDDDPGENGAETFSRDDASKMYRIIAFQWASWPSTFPSC